MAEGTRMKTLEDSVKKTEALLQHMEPLFAPNPEFVVASQQFIAATQQNSQDSAKRRAETDLKIDALTELVKKVIVGSERLLFMANPGDVAGAGLEKSAGVGGSDLPISVTEGSDQRRSSIPRTGNTKANDPTISRGITIRGGQGFNIEAPRQNFEDIEAPRKEATGKQDELHSHFEQSKVTFRSLPWDSLAPRFRKREMGIEMPMRIKDADIGVINFWRNSVGIAVSSSVYQVLVEMSWLVGTIIFDLGGTCGVLDCEIGESKEIYKPLLDQFSFNLVDKVVVAGRLEFTPDCLKGGLLVTFIFDPGGGSNGRECEEGGVGVIEAVIWTDEVDCNAIGMVQMVKRSLLGVLVFDPGGELDNYCGAIGLLLV